MSPQDIFDSCNADIEEVSRIIDPTTRLIVKAILSRQAALADIVQKLASFTKFQE